MSLLDPFSLEIAKNIASLVVKTTWEMGNKPLDKSLKQVIFNASRQYLQHYTKRHGMLKVLGMVEPVPLEEVYINIQLLDEWLPTRIETLTSVDKKYRKKRNRLFGFGEYKKRSGLEMANYHPYLMVLGEPGMGKSTFLRKTGLDALQGRKSGRFVHNCLPVFIELKLFNSEEVAINMLITKEFEICGFPDYQQMTQSHLEQGKLLVLLDGLDEVPTDLMSNVITKIQDFVDRYPKNRFIISCRRAAYLFNFRSFIDVAIADFDDQQIQNFIYNWFHKHLEKGQECWQKLNSAEYAETKELTHTPLLLTLVCLLYERAGQFPTNRATLYNKALRVLLEEWASEKLLPQEHIYKGLDTRRKELMLSKIAHDTFRENALFFSKRELASQIEKLLKELLPGEEVINGEKVLKSVEVQHGILVERAMDIYSFSHLTLQEFLTAQYIADDHEKIKWLVTNCLVSDHWHEVFLLVAGLKQKTDDLLVQMERRTQIYCNNSPKLQALLHWSKQVTDRSLGTDKPIVKQALAISLALDCTRACEFALAIERVRELIRKIAVTFTLRNLNLTTYVTQFEYELNRAFNIARSFALARDQAHYFAQRFGFNQKNFMFKIELGHELEFEQTREFLRSLDPEKIRTLIHNLDQARINVLNHILVGTITQSFAKINIFRDIDLQTLNIRLEMLRGNIISGSYPFEVRRGFIKQIQKTWFDTLEISPDLVSFSSQDLENLKLYLKANKLIVECYSSAVWVKPETWKEIEERMFTLKQ